MAKKTTKTVKTTKDPKRNGKATGQYDSLLMTANPKKSKSKCK